MPSTVSEASKRRAAEPLGAAEGSFQTAVALHRQGRAAEADALCAAALQIDPLHFHAYHLRGLIALKRGDLDRGVGLLEQSLAINPNQASAHCNIGNAYLSRGQAQRALQCFERALALKADYLLAHYNRAIALKDIGRFESALASFEEVLKLDARHAQSLSSCGQVLLELGRLEEALSSFARAIESDPGNVDALIRRAGICERLHRNEAALADYREALLRAPDAVIAHQGAAGVLLSMGRAEAALACYERALTLQPADPDLQCGRGAALLELRRNEEAALAFADVLRGAPAHRSALGQLFSLRMAACDWQDYDSLGAGLAEVLAQSGRCVNPPALMFFDRPDLHLACARAFVEARYAPDGALGPCRIASGVSAQRRIRLAYVSADFTDHPVAQLLVGVLERHDRARFEVIGISLRPGSGGDFERRVRGAFDRCIDVGHWSDLEIASELRQRGVDIAVDLMGFTDGLRPGVFARRAAPVQVSYLGYPSTLGAPYMDYLIADAVVVPPELERCYDEKVVRLPQCFLPNDDRRPLAPMPTRAEAGLPDQGVVFCAFTQAQKIHPPMFDTWMRILRRVEGSVLWLRDIGALPRQNLVREARARGIAPERLVFAPRIAGTAAHLGRMGLADLFLDTLPYNAHSTACDALWAGVPVLTCLGRGFAGRVAASALSSVGLPELITHSLPEYEQRAVELAIGAAMLPALRMRLARQRAHSPLFDTTRYTRHLEAAYLAMHERAARGECPSAFNVDPSLPGSAVVRM